jgi:hypothetical protein
MNKATSSHALIAALVLGALGGGALILTTMLTRRGQMIFLPYGALIAAIALYVRSRRVTSYATRFSASLCGFMLASIILYGYLITAVNPHMLHVSLWRNVWPLLVFALIGSVTSAIVAKVTPARPAVNDGARSA